MLNQQINFAQENCEARTVRFEDNIFSVIFLRNQFWKCIIVCAGPFYANYRSKFTVSLLQYGCVQNHSLIPYSLYREFYEKDHVMVSPLSVRKTVI